MRTRTLLLLSLGCGLAILIAGVGMFWRISQQDDPTTAALGAPTEVGDMVVTVAGSSESDGAPSSGEGGTAGGADPSGESDGPVDGGQVDDGQGDGGQVEIEVSVRLAGAADDVPAQKFALLVDGQRYNVADSDCPAITGDPVECRVWFRFDADDAGARLLSYQRGEDRAVWVLPS